MQKGKANWLRPRGRNEWDGLDVAAGRDYSVHYSTLQYSSSNLRPVTWRFHPVLNEHKAGTTPL